MKYLIDTNIIIDHLRGDQKATDFLLQAEQGKIKALTTVITEYELLIYENIPPHQVEKIKKLFSFIPKRTITSKVAKQAAIFRKKYKTDIADALIAGVAFISKTTLLTRNLKHFQNIKEIKVQSL